MTIIIHKIVFIFRCTVSRVPSGCCLSRLDIADTFDAVTTTESESAARHNAKCSSIV